MPLSLTRQEFVYNAGGTLAPLYNVPVVVDRAPSTNDFALPGQIWIDSAANSIYMLASITANSANWTTSPGSGVGVLTSVTVNPGDVDIVAGDLNVDAGNVDIASGNLLVGGDFTVDGTATFNGDIDITSSMLIDLTSTLNAAPSILLQADGGTSEQIRLYSNQGTAVDSIYLFSNVGGITLRADLASDDAINLNSTQGGVDIDGVMQVNISSSENAVDAISISATAGGLDILCGGTAGEDIDIAATSSVNIEGAEAVADAVTITASNPAGGIKVAAGTGGIEIGNSATCSPIDIGDFVPTSSRLITIAGGTVATAVTDRVDIAVDGVSTSASAAKQVDLASGNVLLGSSVVNINSGTAASGTSTVNISTGTGGGTKVVNIGNADGLTTVNIDGLTTINDNVNANVSINGGTSTGAVAIGNSLADTITLDSSSAISLDAADNSNFSVDGGDLTIESVSDILALSGGDSSDTAISITASDAAGGITVVTGTGGVNVTCADGPFSVVTGTEDISLDAGGLVAITNDTASVASPTVIAVLNVNFGTATFTGFTTAASADEVFTITNSLVTTSSPLIVSVCNEGSNDAQMSVSRVERAAGSFDVTVFNGGAASLNGNVSISFMVGV